MYPIDWNPEIDWTRGAWECQCGIVSESIGDMEHKPGCVARRPDEVDMGVDDEHRIREIMRELRSLARHGYLSEKLDEIEDLRGVRYALQGSTSRTVLLLGRTSPDGNWWTDDRRGLVLKWDPSVRIRDITGRSGNPDEIMTWYQALDRDDEDLFAPLISHARDGEWLLMSEYVPVYPQRAFESRVDGVFDREILRSFCRELESRGWRDPDWKHGNIGISPRDQELRMIDYGTGPDLE